jgi:Ca2+/Na+ antiporter
MSFTDRLLLWLHIGFAIFTLGPVAAAIMATPRYIRKRDLAVLRYLYRTTRIFGVLTVGVFLFGLLLGRHDFSQAWFSAAMTLFIVAAVLLVLVMFDQRRAIAVMDKTLAIDEARGRATEGAAGAAAATAAARDEVTARAQQAGNEQSEDDRAAHAGADQGSTTGGRSGEPAAGGRTEPAAGATPRLAVASASAAQVASVERGRIITMGGVITTIWLVILVLMVWHG